MNFSLLMFNTAVLPFLADAGASATSDGTTGIIIGSGVAGSLVTLAATWIKARYTRKVELSKPVEVALKEQFVTRTEFDKLAVENRADHDNIFNRLAMNDKNVGRMLGLLEGIQGDLSLIKQNLLGGRT